MADKRYDAKSVEDPAFVLMVRGKLNAKSVEAPMFVLMADENHDARNVMAEVPEFTLVEATPHPLQRKK